MNIDKYVILKFKTCPIQMMSHWIIGQVVKTYDHSIHLKEAVNLYENLSPQGNVNHFYVSDHMTTENILNVKLSQIVMERTLIENDAILKGYEKAVSEYRVQKIGLVTPKPDFGLEKGN